VSDATAALIAPPIVLGEHPDWEDRPFPDDRPDEAGAEDASAERAGPRQGLTALACMLERAGTQEVPVALSDLPEPLRCRTALDVLARRARQRGKRVALTQCTPDVRPIAAAAGWMVQGGKGRYGADATRRPSSASPVAPVRIEVGSAGGASIDPASAIARSLGALGLPRGVEPRRHLASVARRAQGLVGTRGEVRRAARSRAAGQSLRLPVSTVWRGVAAALVLVLAVLLMPGATVTLVPATEEVTFDLPVVVDPGIKKPDVAQGKLPGKAISKEVSETAQAPTTGRKPAPDARASGEVVFVNKTDKPVAVPKGTVVLAGNVRFATQADLNVGGTIFSGPQQRISMQRVPVQAVTGGVDGNVGRFQITRMEGPLAGQLDVQNDAATRGGSDKTVAFVTAEDRRKLQESLTRTLTDRLNQQIRSAVPSPDKETVVPWGGANPSVVEATFSKNEGDEAQTLSLTLKIRYGATVFANDAYNDFVRQLVSARAGELKPGYDLDRSVMAQVPQVQSIDSGAVRLLAHAKVTAWPHVDAGKLRAAITNRPVGQANAYVQSLPGVTQASVRAWPGWFGRTPLLGWRIGVRGRA
jgi:hypothetical protein